MSTRTWRSGGATARRHRRRSGRSSTCCPDLPAGTWPEDASRSLVFAQVLAALRAPPDRTPYLLVVEDAHWADEATLDLLRHLARRIHGCSALVMVSYRPEDTVVGDGLRVLLGDTASATGTRRIDLSPLSVEGVVRLAEEHGGVGAAEAAELHAVTGGNPFFVTEALATDGDLPQTVRDAVLARVSRLDGTSQHALELVALAGSRTEAALVGDLLAAGLTALDEPLARGTAPPLGRRRALPPRARPAGRAGRGPGRSRGPPPPATPRGPAGARRRSRPAGPPGRGRRRRGSGADPRPGSGRGGRRPRRAPGGVAPVRTRAAPRRRPATRRAGPAALGPGLRVLPHQPDRRGDRDRRARRASCGTRSATSCASGDAWRCQSRLQWFAGHNEEARRVRRPGRRPARGLDPPSSRRWRSATGPASRCSPPGWRRPVTGARGRSPSSTHSRRVPVRPRCASTRSTTSAPSSSPRVTSPPGSGCWRSRSTGPGPPTCTSTRRGPTATSPPPRWSSAGTSTRSAGSTRASPTASTGTSTRGPATSSGGARGSTSTVATRRPRERTRPRWCAAA